MKRQGEHLPTGALW